MNNVALDFIQNILFDEAVLSGDVFLPSLNRNVHISINTESGNTHLDSLLEESKKLIAYLSIQNYNKFRNNILEEISECACEEEGYQLSEEEFEKLSNDLDISQLTVFSEGFTLEYSSPTEMPNHTIVIQLAKDFMIEDLAVYEE